MRRSIQWLVATACCVAGLCAGEPSGFDGRAFVPSAYSTDAKPILLAQGLSLRDPVFLTLLTAAASVADGCPVAAVDLDGTSDYMTRGSDLTGNADGKKGTISFWFRLDGGNGSALSVIYNAAANLRIFRQADNTWRVYGEQVGGSTIILTLNSIGTYTAGASWNHFLASWDLAIGAGDLYINDIDDLAGSPVLTNATLDYTDTDWVIGANQAVGAKFNGALSEIWFSNTLNLDLSVEANRRFFRTSTGKPADLASDPTAPGATPIIYFKNAAATWGTNTGSGGTFTITGAPSDASTTPCD